MRAAIAGHRCLAPLLALILEFAEAGGPTCQPGNGGSYRKASRLLAIMASRCLHPSSPTPNNRLPCEIFIGQGQKIARPSVCISRCIYCLRLIYTAPATSGMSLAGQSWGHDICQVREPIYRLISGPPDAFADGAPACSKLATPAHLAFARPTNRGGWDPRELTTHRRRYQVDALPPIPPTNTVCYNRQ